MSIEHWMIFGTFAEQRYFTYPSPDTYTGVIFNANMVSHAPDGLAAFLLEKTKKIIYIIDPLTHAFQHDPSAITKRTDDGTVEVKSSILGLSKAYGEPIYSLAGDRPILPDDFKNPHIHEDFVENCLNFQKTELLNAMTSSDSIKYFVDYSNEDLKPYALVAPYFFMTETSFNYWIDLNIASAKLALKYKNSCKLYVEIVISQDIILSEDILNILIDKYTKLDVDGFIIWIDDFDEHNSASAELKGFLKLARGLRKDGRFELINLHGSYFSILVAGTIGNSLLTGVAHGPEFGEFRPVVPVGGGIPIARYYIRLLHDRIKYRDSVRILRSKKWLEEVNIFHNKVCNCAECRNTINNDLENFTLFGEANPRVVKRGSSVVTMQFPTSETKERCLKHYLENKAFEFQFSATASKSQILDDLQTGIDEYKVVVGLDGISHLELWKKILA